LASSFNSIGRYEEAARLYQHYFQFLQQTKGNRHPDTISVMRQLGIVYIDQSLLSEAEPLCNEALKISREVLGNEHNVTLRLLDDLGMLYQKQGEYEKAKLAHNECLEVKLRIQGDRHPHPHPQPQPQPQPQPHTHTHTLSIKSNLALLDERLNRFDAAQAQHHEVLEVQLSETFRKQLRIAAALNNLGRCYMKRGWFSEDPDQFVKGESLLKMASGIYERQHGSDHPDTLRIQSNLAQVYCELRQYDAAELILPGLVERLTHLRGPDHVTTLEAMNLRGWTDMHQDRLAEAENFLEVALENCPQRDQKDPLALQIGGNLANSYLRTGDSVKTVLWTDRQIESARIHRPTDSRQLAIVFAGCGSRLLKAEAWKEAERVLNDRLDIRTALESDSAPTFNTQSMLGEALSEQQRISEAEDLLIKGYRGQKNVRAGRLEPVSTQGCPRKRSTD
jgi:tetratricopeptide (TPR) repeat protein